MGALDLNMLIAPSQLISGIATLIIAIILVFQLRKQNDELAHQRENFNKDLSIQILERWDSLALSLATNREMLDIYMRGRQNYNSLSDATEENIFHWVSTSAINLLLMKYTHGDVAGFDRKRHITEHLSRSRGIRHAYRSKRLRHQFSKEYQTVLDALVKHIDDTVCPDGLCVTESEYPHGSNGR